MAFLSVLLDGTAYGMILFIISVGLTVTMGLMRVVNLAHGAFAMTGGYLAAIMIKAGMPFFAAAILAALAVGALGAVAELVLYKPLYRRGELPQALMTFGFTFVVIAALTSIFGSNVKPLPIPAALAGNTDLGFTQYPTYRLFLIVLGAVMALALWLVIDRTLYGARLRAAVDNPRMARAVGMDVNLLFTGTFAGGCALAGFGGVVGADMLPVEPYYALRYLVIFLVVVAVGGIGNFKGSFVAALAIGIISTVFTFLLPGASAYIVYALVLVLLLWRPHGLLPAKSAP
ncbi:MAG TPA: branched-chain amino acid ABC transporter permease [Stellaceae bacterium]|jgi:branched-chain amino acid transport system permease protein|nr:branched-chain amino acid ABC transporter permease [Stellaceae bacterium]